MRKKLKNACGAILQLKKITIVCAECAVIIVGTFFVQCSLSRVILHKRDCSYQT